MPAEIDELPPRRLGPGDEVDFDEIARGITPPPPEEGAQEAGSAEGTRPRSSSTGRLLDAFDREVASNFLPPPLPPAAPPRNERERVMQQMRRRVEKAKQEREREEAEAVAATQEEQENDADSIEERWRREQQPLVAEEEGKVEGTNELEAEGAAFPSRGTAVAPADSDTTP
jgi:hypothetical protein